MKFSFFTYMVVLAIVMGLSSDEFVFGRRARGTGTTKVTTTRYVPPRTTVTRRSGGVGISPVGVGVGVGLGVGAGVAAASATSRPYGYAPVLATSPVYGQPVVVKRRGLTTA